MELALLEVLLQLMGPVGAVIAVVAFFVMRSKVNPDTYLQSITDRLARLEGENEHLLDKVNDLQKQLVALQIENAELLAKITLLESAHQSLPLPMWLKDEHGRVLSINTAYEDIFLKPRGYERSDYVGHYDADVWPDHIAAQFMVNDRRVFKNQETWIGTEKIDTPEGDKEWQIIKYVRYAGEIPVGIGGMAIPIQDYPNV